MTTALLVIDMQNDFVAPNAAIPVVGIRDGLPRFAEFIQAFREKAAPIIYTRHCYHPSSNPVEAELFPELNAEGLRQGSVGWQICDELTPRDSELIIDKPRYDAFFRTNLLAELQTRQISTLVISGTMTEVCCESTARSAMYHDFRVVFCSDLTFCSSPARHQNTLSVISSHFGTVLSAQEIMEQFL